MKAGLALLVSLVLAGCCTEAGCIDGLVTQLGAVADEFVVGEPVQVTVCVDGTCVVDTLTRHAESGFLEGARIADPLDPNALRVRGLLTDGTHAVSLELSRGGAVVFGTSRETVSTRTFTPNGPFCPPVCRGATSSLSPVRPET